MGSNNSCNCLSPKCLVISKDWPQRDEFINKVKLVLASKPPLPAYYPGTEERYNGFKSAYPEDGTEFGAVEGMHEVVNFRYWMQKEAPQSCQIAGSTAIKRLPPLIVHCKADASEYALNNEAFAPVLAIVQLPGATAEEFLPHAVEFCNDSIFGPLSCSLTVHPTTADAAVEKAIA